MARRFAALVRQGKYEQPAGMQSAHLPHPLNSEGESQARQLVGSLHTFGSQFGAAIGSTIGPVPSNHDVHAGSVAGAALLGFLIEYGRHVRNNAGGG